ncbi:hypothetical protein EV643_10334 [Kribbella sp. VKM Ac-2527]|uniref:Uncharacterized protein n=1 Tax=Kribbella caucasensis TaxID=2512215 RepID=A0A4R6KJ26_9ACTN|nr:hypothetical protein [Kribbella sp. VKM Ac-2527]TDO51297.1 hypothetical protein EV643_10334 [Kribbella sp. VKM Ac-2527]
MTSYPGQPAPQRSRTLTWIAIACFVVGLAVSGFFVSRIVKNVPETPTAVESGPVQLEKEGLTVYASQPVLTPPCEAKDASGSDIPLKQPSASETITLNSRTYYVVARSVNPVPPQSVSVSCTDGDTNATYYVGPRMSVVAFVLSILGAVFAFIIFVIAGVILLVVDTTKRRRSNRPGNTFPGSGNPPGNTYPGNQPPQFPGNTFPGNQPPPYPTQPPGNPYPGNQPPYPGQQDYPPRQ